MWTLVAAACLAVPSDSHAPPTAGPVRATALTAVVEIVDDVSTTRLRLRLANDGPRQEEATWILPLAPGAVADDFRMRVGGVESTGEILSAGTARGVYERIVRARRDPGLLEYLERGCLRARVFPIPPGGEMEVEVTYREVLPELGGLRRWAFPLAAAGLEGAPPESIVLDLSITSRRELRNVFSPSRGLHVVSDDDRAASASFEGTRGSFPERELAVLYGLSDAEFGLDLMSTRRADEELGTFLMSISPRRAHEGAPIAGKSVVFALDVSGSMQGEKIEQARGATRYFLRSLRRDDRFNVIPFSTDAEPYFPAPVQATPQHVRVALARTDALEARGGTNIDGALEAAFAAGSDDGKRVPLIVLLTDGKPTVREEEPAAILRHAKAWNRAGSRVFVFGVGDAVNTQLLDTLAEEHGGVRTYVREHEHIELAASDLFSKLSRPALTDLVLVAEGVTITGRVPARLPDLFHGGRLVVLGRYRGAGHHAIRLRGTVAGERREFVYEASFADGPVEVFDFVPSLWAERRVAMLLDQVRLHGPDPELIDEMTRLGIEHRIVTPYTSHLILEEGLRGARGSGYAGPGDSAPPRARGSGSPSPSGGSSTARGGPASPGPSTAGRGGGGRDAPSVDVLAQRLRDAGVLPDDAPPAELQRLALEVAAEMRAADRALRGLGGRDSGAGAIEDSLYLGRMMRSESPLTGSDDFYLGRGEDDGAVDLVARFTRRVRGVTFVLRAGVWTDRALLRGEGDPAAEPERVRVEAYSRAWFDLLRTEPGLTPYLAFSERLDVLFEGVVYEVRPPPPPESEEGEDSAGTRGR